MAKAYYTDLSIKIQTLLEQAKDELKIAVAWFTNPFLFRIVENMLDKKVKVKIIISDSPHNFGKLDFKDLERKGAEVYVCQSNLGRFMHNKFCIIDNKIAFSGSYNWSLNAEEKYFENIIVADGEDVVNPLSKFFNKIIDQSRRFGHAIVRDEEFQSIEAREDDYFYNLQSQFEVRVNESIKQTIALRVSIDTDNIYTLIKKYTAIGAAKMLTSSMQGTNLQPGFRKLARKGRLDLTFEYLITLPEFEPLFTPEIIKFAQSKLELGRVEAELPPPPRW